MNMWRGNVALHGWRSTRAVCLLVLALGLTQPLRTGAFDTIYAFGDSLTDTGNNPAPTVGYYEGRYSNGPLWIEYLSTQLGLTYNPNNNFAQSGAQTTGALDQVRRFTPPTNAATALFVVWAGGNDFIQNFAQVLTQGLNDAFWNGVVSAGVSNLVASINALYADGARTIVVPNLVDLSRIPVAADLPSFVLTYFQNKVILFNTSLTNALSAIRAAHPDLQLLEPDVFGQFNHVLAHLGANGFTQGTIDALDDPQLSDKSFNGPGADYVFWDSIHPTTKAHTLIAQWFDTLLPLSAAPQLSVTAASSHLLITFAKLQVGRVYTLQSSTNLTTWSDASTITATNTAQQSTVNTNSAATGFFRLKS
jgi:phospholipase/lecithinase/hemolysin